MEIERTLTTSAGPEISGASFQPANNANGTLKTRHRLDFGTIALARTAAVPSRFRRSGKTPFDQVS